MIEFKHQKSMGLLHDTIGEAIVLEVSLEDRTLAYSGKVQQVASQFDKDDKLAAAAVYFEGDQTPISIKPDEGRTIYLDWRAVR